MGAAESVDSGSHGRGVSGRHRRGQSVDPREKFGIYPRTPDAEQARARSVPPPSRSLRTESSFLRLEPSAAPSFLLRDAQMEAPQQTPMRLPPPPGVEIDAWANLSRLAATGGSEYARPSPLQQNAPFDHRPPASGCSLELTPPSLLTPRSPAWLALGTPQGSSLPSRGVPAAPSTFPSVAPAWPPVPSANFRPLSEPRFDGSVRPIPDVVPIGAAPFTRHADHAISPGVISNIGVLSPVPLVEPIGQSSAHVTNTVPMVSPQYNSIDPDSGVASAARTCTAVALPAEVKYVGPIGSDLEAKPQPYACNVLACPEGPVQSEELTTLSNRVTSVLQRCQAVLAQQASPDGSRSSPVTASEVAQNDRLARSLVEAESDFARMGNQWRRLQEELESARSEVVESLKTFAVGYGQASSSKGRPWASERQTSTPASCSASPAIRSGVPSKRRHRHTSREKHLHEIFAGGAGRKGRHGGSVPPRNLDALHTSRNGSDLVARCDGAACSGMLPSADQLELLKQCHEQLQLVRQYQQLAQAPVGEQPIQIFYPERSQNQIVQQPLQALALQPQWQQADPHVHCRTCLRQQELLLQNPNYQPQPYICDVQPWSSSMNPHGEPEAYTDICEGVCGESVISLPAPVLPRSGITAQYHMQDQQHVPSDHGTHYTSTPNDSTGSSQFPPLVVWPTNPAKRSGLQQTQLSKLYASVEPSLPLHGGPVAQQSGNGTVGYTPDYYYAPSDYGTHYNSTPNDSTASAQFPNAVWATNGAARAGQHLVDVQCGNMHASVEPPVSSRSGDAPEFRTRMEHDGSMNLADTKNSSNGTHSGSVVAAILAAAVQPDSAEGSTEAIIAAAEAVTAPHSTDTYTEGTFGDEHTRPLPQEDTKGIEGGIYAGDAGEVAKASIGSQFTDSPPLSLQENGSSLDGGGTCVIGGDADSGTESKKAIMHQGSAMSGSLGHHSDDNVQAHRHDEIASTTGAVGVNTSPRLMSPPACCQQEVVGIEAMQAPPFRSHASNCVAPSPRMMTPPAPQIDETPPLDRPVIRHTPLALLPEEVRELDVRVEDHCTALEAQMFRLSEERAARSHKGQPHFTIPSHVPEVLPDAVRVYPAGPHNGHHNLHHVDHHRAHRAVRHHNGHHDKHNASRPLSHRNMYYDEHHNASKTLRHHNELYDDASKTLRHHNELYDEHHNASRAFRHHNGHHVEHHNVSRASRHHDGHHDEQHNASRALRDHNGHHDEHHNASQASRHHNGHHDEHHTAVKGLRHHNGCSPSPVHDRATRRKSRRPRFDRS